MPNIHSTLTSLFTDIADAIRSKTGSSASIVADAFPTAIAAIPTGITPSGTINITSNGTYDVTSYASASVSAQGDYYTVYKAMAYRSLLSPGIEGMPEWCSTLSKIESAQFLGTRMTGTFNFPNATSIASEAFRSAQYAGGYVYNVAFSFPVCTNIDAYAFAGRYYINDVYFPECISISACAFMNTIFSGNKSLDFPEVAYISNSAFSGARFNYISLPKCGHIGSSAFTGASVISAYIPKCSSLSACAFMNCSYLSDLVMNSVEFIANGAFSSCINLKSFIFDSCSYIGDHAFFNCGLSGILNASLVALVLPYGFYSTKITEAHLPACTNLSSYAFCLCASLSYVSLPILTTISGYIFENTLITSLYLPRLNNTFAYTFRNMRNLNTAVFVDITAVSGASVFQNCYNLLSLYLLGSSVATLTNANAFYSTPISTYTTSTGGVYGSIFVPTSLYDTYIAATNWKTFSARFVSMTDAQISAFLSSLG